MTAPTFIIHNPPNRGCANSKSIRQIPLRSDRVIGPDLPHLLPRQFNWRTSRPVFCAHISSVIGLRSKKEMVRINARWIVTVMQNEKPIGNASEFNDPRKPMRLDRSPVYPFLSAIDNAIAVIIYAGEPKPATAIVRQYKNLLPKPIFDGGREPQFGYKVGLHSKSVLLCRAPATLIARGHFQTLPRPPKGVN